jgi:hypothetical protein
MNIVFSKMRFCGFKAKLTLGLFLLFGSFLNAVAQYPAGSPVAINGQLSVNGSRMVNECGNVVQLRGMSTHGVQWFGNCLNASSVQALAKDWKIDILRIAMYIQEGGYVTNPSYYKTVIDNLVDECGKQGIYVIIDFHVHLPGDPVLYLPEAKEFWDYFANKHKGTKHVLYEICNEPSGVTWARVKEYANEMIPRIRTIDPKTIIICGSSRWSQDLDKVASDRLNYDNLMYAFHFYAGTHTMYLRSRVDSAIAKGLPVMVTEWGTNDVSSLNPPSPVEAMEWIRWMNENKISWMNWSFSDKNESSAALLPGSCGTQLWNNTSVSGTFIKDQILNSPKDFVCFKNPLLGTTDAYNNLPINLPGRIQVEYFDKNKNFYSYLDFTTANRGKSFRDTEVDLEPTLDKEGNYNIGFIQPNEWLKFTTNATEAGLYDVSFRVGSNVTTAFFHAEINDVNVTGPINVPNTGSFQKYTNVVVKGLNLNAGLNNIKIVFETASLNMNYFDVTKSASTTVAFVAPSSNKPFGASAAVIPGRVEAENFDLGGNQYAYLDLDVANKGAQYRLTDYVDIQTTKDSAGLYNIGWTQAGEWLKYTVNVLESGYYDIIPRTAFTTATSVMHIEIDGNDVTNDILFPVATNWKSTIVPNVHLKSGLHTMRVVFHTAGFNLNYIDFVKKITPNQNPTVGLAVSSSSLVAPATVSLEATAADVDGSIAKVEFFNGITKIGEDLTAPFTFSMSSLAVGSYSVSAKATDNLGATATSTALVFVVSSNVPPVVSILTPLNNATFTAPATISISVTATDADGSIALVEFYNGATKIGENATSPYTYNLANVVEGTYTITAKATDNMGASTISSSIVANVIKATNTGTGCTTYLLPASTDYSLLSDWNDQSSGTIATNTADALMIRHRQWGNVKLWVAQKTQPIDVVAGTEYVLTFDFKNDASNPVVGLEAALSSGLDWNAPRLLQPSVAITGNFGASDYTTGTATFTAVATGKVGVSFLLKFATQPNLAVNAYLKSINLCNNSSSNARVSDQSLIEHVAISPNPSSGQTSVVLEGFDLESLTEVYLYDLAGMLISHVYSTENNILLNADNQLKSGMYLLKVVKNERIYNLNFIKN